MENIITGAIEHVKLKPAEGLAVKALLLLMITNVDYQVRFLTIYTILNWK